MNSKGQSTSLSIIGMIFFFIVGMLTVTLLLDDVSNARNNLNCSSADSITGGTMLLCLIFDLTIPLWVWIILAVVGGILVSRVLIG